MCKKSLTEPSTVTVIYIRIKYVLLDTESMTVITMSKPMEFGSSTIKSILIVFHLTLSSKSKYSFPRGNQCISLVYK